MPNNNQVNKLLKKYHNSDCTVLQIARIAGNWQAVLTKKPDSFTESFLNRMFSNISISWEV
jgi:hypothetical protein